MNWSNVKSVMIVFLILVNLSFLTYIIYEEVQVNKKNEQMAQTTASLLQSRNISVDAKIIADCANFETAQNVYVENIISEYSSFSEIIIGNSSEMISENSYRSEIGTVEFSGDFFNAQAAENKYLYEKHISSQNVKDISKRYLETLSIDTRKTQPEVIEKNNKYKLIYKKEINSLPVFNTGITVEADNKGITAIYGNWYNASSHNSSVAELKNISGILVEYMNKKANTSNIKIDSISLCYNALTPDTYHESVFLTPVWKISDQEEDFYIDARENF